jgi:polyisoprenoid-binding protein YceI
MIRRRAVLTFAVSLIAAAAPMLATAAAAPWAVDKAKSRVGWRATVMGQTVDGQFQRYDAAIRFDPKKLAESQATISIDVASVSSGDHDRDTMLPSGDWFDTKTFPRATFKTRGFKDLGGGRYQAMGDLTIRNVTRPVVLPFTLSIAGDTAKMTGSLPIDRGVFGVGQGQFKGPETVAPTVQVMLSIVAKRAG